MRGNKMRGRVRGGMDTTVAAIVCVALVGLSVARAVYQSPAKQSRVKAGKNAATGSFLRSANDCNNDGIPDEIEIAVGASQDCNGNGVPDECDISSGTSPDCNGNVVPDQCELDTPNGLVGTYAGLFIGIQDNFEPLDNIEPFETVRGRIDPTVDFDWGFGGIAPWPGFDDDSFSIRWAGYVLTPNVSGVYTFYTRTDDGVRLWVNDQLIIDEWYDQSPTEHAGTITLEANRAYRVVMEYYENQVIAVAELRWEPPGQPKVIIPTENLIPGLDCNANTAPDDCDSIAGGDFDSDGDVDATDYTAMASVLDGPGIVPSLPSAECLNAYLSAFDFDEDGDIDLADYAAFQAVFTGP